MTQRKQIKKSVRFDVMNRDGFRCRYCGTSCADGTTVHIDHIVPVSRGGTNDKSNLVTACADCNMGKGVKSLNHDIRFAEPDTYGLSFDSDGRCQYQFVVEKSSKHAVRIMTFSWMSGEDYETKTVSKKFLNNRCLLFACRDDFLKAADYWGEFRAERVNQNFLEEGAA